MHSSVAFIGIGSNIGDPAHNCLAAVDNISRLEKTQLLRRSSFYRTEPVGVRDQEWFINCAVEIRTELTPEQLLGALQSIELNMGRTRGEKWGPRIIDLDILFYGQEIIRSGGLTIPHPELHKRRFVLVPLNEIASFAIHPVFGVSVRGLLDRLRDDLKVVRIENI